MTEGNLVRELGEDCLEIESDTGREFENAKVSAE